jgi:hypothetical protein
LDYTTAQGERRSEEMVLAKHPALNEMNLAMAKFSASLAAAMGRADTPGSAAVEAELRHRNLGLLRYGQDYRVVTVSTRTPDAARFTLPAAPMAMPDLGGLGGMIGGETGGSAGGTSANGGLGAIFGQKLGRQQDRVEARAEGEADAATDRAVDKVLDKAFGKIFGGE